MKNNVVIWKNSNEALTIAINIKERTVIRMSEIIHAIHVQAEKFEKTYLFLLRPHEV